eukprot:TRINITY_DN2740_c0_g7_i1.p1 TRINITY_DN2740_c0_g7~~TRINITY_DN2740_c0_g7_i1.p1  ORF type:complete len:507 (-),score=138.22 TRINITY_DN2740_c0_g7_i1:79-1599(-)
MEGCVPTPSSIPGFEAANQLSPLIQNDSSPNSPTSPSWNGSIESFLLLQQRQREENEKRSQKRKDLRRETSYFEKIFPPSSLPSPPSAFSLTTLESSRRIFNEKTLIASIEKIEKKNRQSFVSLDELVSEGLREQQVKEREHEKEREREREVGLISMLSQQSEEQKEKEENEKEKEKTDEHTQRIDKFGFVLSENEQQQEESKKQKEREVARAEKWATMLSQWKTFATEKKGKLRQRCLKGFPDRLRGQLWKKLVKADEFMASHSVLFNEMVDKSSGYEEQIQKDLNRTFPKHILFRNGGSGQKSLYNVLNSYSNYHKELGYTQGMGFIVALVLIYMTEEEAFAFLVRLNRHPPFLLEGLFIPGFPLLHFWLSIHDLLLDASFPKLANHLRNEGVNSSMYALAWYSSVFTSILPFRYVIRIWDVFLLMGPKFLFGVSMAILKIHMQDLLRSDFELLMEKLISFPRNLSLPPDDLIKAASEINLNRVKIDKLTSEYYAKNGIQYNPD